MWFLVFASYLYTIYIPLYIKVRIYWFHVCHVANISFDLCAQYVHRFNSNLENMYLGLERNPVSR